MSVVNKLSNTRRAGGGRATGGPATSDGFTGGRIQDSEGFQARLATSEIKKLEAEWEKERQEIVQKAAEGKMSREDSIALLESTYNNNYKDKFAEYNKAIDLGTPETAWKDWKESTTYNIYKDYGNGNLEEQDRYFTSSGRTYDTWEWRGAPGTHKRKLHNIEENITQNQRFGEDISYTFENYGPQTVERLLKNYNPKTLYSNESYIKLFTDADVEVHKMPSGTSRVGKSKEHKNDFYYKSGVNPYSTTEIMDLIKQNNKSFYNIYTEVTNEATSKSGKSSVYRSFGYKDSEHIDYSLKTQKDAIEKYEEQFAKTLGPTWENDSRVTKWMETDNFKLNKGGDNVDFIASLMGEDKANEFYKSIDAGQKFIPGDTFGEGKWEAYPKKNGINIFGPGGLLRGENILDVFKNIGEFAVDVTLNTALNTVTALADPFVAGGEFLDDVFDGDNVFESLFDATLKTFQLDHIVDAADDISNGDVGAAIADLGEYGAQASAQQGAFSSGDPTNFLDPNITTATADLGSVAEVTLGDPEVSVEQIEEYMDPEIPEFEERGINMPKIEKTTMDELKQLLGIMPGPGTDQDVIPALIGSEARKIADDPDVLRMRQLYGDVAETGYDAGERETLSGKARRELAGLARQQGLAAGAAAGGLRGASVGAQARSLAEKAMQKQADVTTEMDKAAISRKDAARKDLATLAKDVSKFDIEKEQERKKRKGATTIGIQSLLQGEEMAKQQLALAEEASK